MSVRNCEEMFLQIISINLLITIFNFILGSNELILVILISVVIFQVIKTNFLPS